MIAAVKRWHAVLCALPFFIPPGAHAAEDLNGAAHDLARQTAAFAGAGEPVSVEYRNVSSLGPAEFGQARGAFEAALKEAGLRVSDVAPVAELRLTLSENQSQYLLVEEARKGDERQVWMAAWKRAEPAAAALPGMALDRKLVWEQEEQILDVAFPAAGMLVLSPSKVTLYTPRENGSWALRSGRSAGAWETVAARPPRPAAGDRREFSGVSAGHRVRRRGGAFALRWNAGRATSPGYWNRAAAPRCWPISPLRAITSTGAWPPGPVCEKR